MDKITGFKVLDTYGDNASLTLKSGKTLSPDEIEEVKEFIKIQKGLKVFGDVLAFEGHDIVNTFDNYIEENNITDINDIGNTLKEIQEGIQPEEEFDREQFDRSMNIVLGSDLYCPNERDEIIEYDE